MRNLSKLIFSALLVISCAIAGCGDPGNEAINGELNNENNNNTGNTAFQSDNNAMNMQADKAVAVVNSANSDVSGWVTFTRMNDGVRVHAELSGLTQGEHGFHIHQYGDCRADDYSSAGGHYNPANQEHDAPEDSTRHMGDMGNIQAENGSATLDYIDSVIQINRIIGRAVIIHQGQDDLTSQPSGAAGSRIACGVIGYVNPDFMTGESNTGS